MLFWSYLVGNQNDNDGIQYIHNWGEKLENSARIIKVSESFWKWTFTEESKELFLPAWISSVEMKGFYFYYWKLFYHFFIQQPVKWKKSFPPYYRLDKW